MKKQLLLITLLLLTVHLVNGQINKKPKNKKLKTGTFQCNEYWIMKNTQWDSAYDDVKVSSQYEMILKSKDSIWGVIFLGTLTVQDDTIHVNQENGYDNICHQIGKVRIGDSVFVEGYKRKELFRIINDSLVEFAGNQFIKSKMPVLYGCWCVWK
ncbi:MAG: hypothetical protein U0264_11040 [Candidatus Kapaibacterium sp.]